MVCRISRSLDFEQALAARSRASSLHFSVHHLARGPAPSAGHPSDRPAEQLSTAMTANRALPVDEPPQDGQGLLRPGALPATCHGLWLGMVVPKRCARRSVTRNLIRREVRSGVERHASILEAGLWVVRLRAPFERSQYVSAASAALRRAVRSEVDAVLRRAMRPDR